MNGREQAWCLLTEFTQSESLRKHGLAVEACMRAYARKFACESPEKEELWGVVGLLHDFDYEKYPSLDDHPYRGNEILKERGYSDEIRRAIMSHAEYSGVTRDSSMEKALFACDELAGFIAGRAGCDRRLGLGLTASGTQQAHDEPRIDTREVRDRKHDETANAELHSAAE